MNSRSLRWGAAGAAAAVLLRAGPMPDPAPASPTGAARPVLAEAATGWTLAFADEFEGRTLDPGRWTTCYWWDEGGCTNLANAEQEWYLPANVSVADGRLRLTAREQQTTNRRGSFAYSSGMVTTGRSQWKTSEERPRFAFRYGRVEMRAKLPAGRGLWPALWLLPVSHEWPPELDVAEVVGQRPRGVLHTAHYRDEAGRPASVGRWVRGPDTSRGFHTFALEWRPGSLRWFVDGKQTLQVRDRDAIPDEPMYVLINLAVGGTLPGAPDRQTRFPASMSVDYLRIWTAAPM